MKAQDYDTLLEKLDEKRGSYGFFRVKMDVDCNFK